MLIEYHGPMNCEFMPAKEKNIYFLIRNLDCATATNPLEHRCQIFLNHCDRQFILLTFKYCYCTQISRCVCHRRFVISTRGRFHSEVIISVYMYSCRTCVFVCKIIVLLQLLQQFSNFA